ncbi:hypothetical protein [Snuella lapsa]|uniref:Uncharacterized protein n=1 Tax=Snuella lapsa TaxID=870481 RepID=A0ABP6WZG0_9FLAO
MKIYQQVKVEVLIVLKEIKRIKFSYLVLYVLSLALLYKYAFFKAFNVNITAFISISDLYVLFIDLIPGLVHFFLLTVASAFILVIVGETFERIKDIFKPLKKNKKRKTQNREEKQSLFNVIPLNLMAFIMFKMMLTVYSFPFVFYNPNDESIYNFTAILTRFSFVLGYAGIYLSTVSYLNGVGKNKKILNLRPELLKTLSLALTLFYITGIAGTLEAGFRMLSFSEDAIEFEYDGVKIDSSDKNTVYAGNTGSYIFIFNKDSAKTKSYKVSDIKSVSFYHDIISEQQSYMSERDKEKKTLNEIELNQNIDFLKNNSSNKLE